jgi:putative membrane protein
LLRLLILLREIVVDSLRCWLAAIAGFSIAFVLSGGVQLLDGDGLAIVFVAGSIAVSAMILPGISGSLLLIILGQYIPMYSALNEFLDGIGRAASGAGIEAIVGPGAVVVTFLLGGLVGLFTIARLIRRMLETYRKTTLAFLVGLIVGALRAPITELSSREGFTWTAAAVSQFVVVAAIGAIFVLALDRYAVNIDLNTL